MPLAVLWTPLRSALLLAAVAGVLLLGSTSPARAETTSPQIVLLGPTDGATIHSSMENPTAVTFRWRIDWQPTTTDPVIISLKFADDPYFTQNVTGENHSCPAETVNCWSSFTPPRVYSHRYYWRVSIVAPVQADSPVLVVHRYSAPSACRHRPGRAPQHEGQLPARQEPDADRQ
jgi:hypothetical protein